MIEFELVWQRSFHERWFTRPWHPWHDQHVYVLRQDGVHHEFRNKLWQTIKRLAHGRAGHSS